jgi:hypothetical protein
MQLPADDAERRVLARQAADSLCAIFRELAPSEALTRALVAERTECPLGADFWIAVYQRCKASRRGVAGRPAA